jgi:hypothetical protein
MPPKSRRIHFITREMLDAMLSDIGLTIMEVQKSRLMLVVFLK